MRSITIHDDRMPGPIQDFTVKMDGHTTEEVLREVGNTLAILKEAEKDPDTYMKKAYGTDW